MNESQTSTTSIKPKEHNILKAVFLVVIVGITLFLGWHVVMAYKHKGSTELANPAAINCLEQGGSNSIMTRPDGSQYGVCIFEDNMQCEDWAMLHGDCPVGGIKVTGYNSDAEVFCAITGGEVSNGNCIVDGTTCSLDSYYDGSCTAE